MNYVKKVSWGGVLMSEWTKFWTLRSNVYGLVGSVLITIAFGAAVGYAVSETGTQQVSLAGVDPVVLSLAGLNLAQVCVPVLAIMTMTGEYSTGSIKSTLTCVPDRMKVLGSKGLVFSSVAFVLFLATSASSVVMAQHFMSGTKLTIDYGDPSVVRALAGAAAGMALLSLLGIGLGTLLRSTAGAIGVFVVALTVAPQFASMLPYDWVSSIVQYMPMRAMQAMMSLTPSDNEPSTLWGAIALSLWALVSMASAGLVLGRRDS